MNKIRPIEKCHECGEREKVGYKYCEPCSRKVQGRNERLSQVKRRDALKTPCVECKDTLTNTKYCASCAQKVRVRTSAEYYKERKRRKVPCTVCGVQTTGIKYCVDCACVAKKESEKSRKIRVNGVLPDKHEGTINPIFTAPRGSKRKKVC